MVATGQLSRASSVSCMGAPDWVRRPRQARRQAVDERRPHVVRAIDRIADQLGHAQGTSRARAQTFRRAGARARPMTLEAVDRDKRGAAPAQRWPQGGKRPGTAAALGALARGGTATARRHGGAFTELPCLLQLAVLPVQRPGGGRSRVTHGTRDTCSVSPCPRFRRDGFLFLNAGWTWAACACCGCMLLFCFEKKEERKIRLSSNVLLLVAQQQPM